jgi:peptidoglycan/xylan/chitin deacetylase (PgdA/CDA1 family)
MTEEFNPRNLEAALQRGTWIFAYHAILTQRSNYLYDVSTTQLEEHLRLFALRDGAKEPALRLTFDDGHRSNYENAFPMLEKSGVNGTFFLVAGSVGADSNYMSWEQARKMAIAGHRLQSHGWSHRLLTACNPRQLDDELVRSKGEIEDRLGAAVDSLSVPGGRWNQRVVERSARAGYRFIFHSNPWAKPTTVDGINLRGRLMVTGQMTKAVLQAKIDSSPARQVYFRAKYNLKEQVRSALGDNLYHRFWCWRANYDPSFGMEVSVNAGGEALPTEGNHTGEARG